MKLSEFKNKLLQIENFTIQLPNGTMVPSHFHITEMGLITKNFIDCGNTIREEKFIVFQVWYAQDFEHKLLPNKVLKIIDASRKLIGNQDLELEVEYQTEFTIGKFGLDFNESKFILTPKETTCLANDHCGVGVDKVKTHIEEKEKVVCCASGTGCC